MARSPKSLFLILGNQLFDPSLLPSPDYIECVMIEDYGLCTHERYHQQKILLFLSAMRSYADELRLMGHHVHYVSLDLTDTHRTFEESLENLLQQTGITNVMSFEIEDHFFEERMNTFFKQHNLDYQVLQSPMFLNTRAEFSAYLSQVKKPWMKTFYEKSRKEKRILVDKALQPVGGKWSFDEENRLKLSREHAGKNTPPRKSDRSKHEKDVAHLVHHLFSDHPGHTEHFMWATTRAEAKKQLSDFIGQRLVHFGAYEDAIEEHEDFMYHSRLSPSLNLGLLTPQLIIDAVLKAYDIKQRPLPIASVEAIIRQILGWREFVRGIYHSYDEKQSSLNFFGHQRKLSDVWYQGNSGIVPLDAAIKRSLRWGYTHHIERLMVLGCLMLLSEIKPREAHRWFMQMYVDSSDWVMGPNVYGMALFSDGGIFATKPYICGSNYILKMSHYAKAPWCDLWDGLYWRFINKHRTFFLSNPRMSMMVRSYDKLTSERKLALEHSAQKALSILTTLG